MLSQSAAVPAAAAAERAAEPQYLGGRLLKSIPAGTSSAPDSALRILYTTPVLAETCLYPSSRV